MIINDNVCQNQSQIQTQIIRIFCQVMTWSFLWYNSVENLHIFARLQDHVSDVALLFNQFVMVRTRICMLKYMHCLAYKQIHIDKRHLYCVFLALLPLNISWQWQWNPSARTVHVPPLRHFTLVQYSGAETICLTTRIS